MAELFEGRLDPRPLPEAAARAAAQADSRLRTQCSGTGTLVRFVPNTLSCPVPPWSFGFLA